MTYWLAYYPDWSDFAVFDDGLSALRYAIKNGMQCAEMRYGTSVREALT